MFSCAQNQEDLILWKALYKVPQGFYIDVGANDPIADSVTKLFYDQQWSGINIEPSIQYYTKLCIDRPRDINLSVAISDLEKDMIFYDIDIRGWSTLDDQVANMHKQSGHQVSQRLVHTITLNQIWKDYVKGPVHFLKIDVEGGEEKVLRGLDLKTYRPWIIVSEATIPNSLTPSYSSWEPLLLNNNYEHVYSDIVNRYYLAKEHKELINHF